LLCSRHSRPQHLVVSDLTSVSGGRTLSRTTNDWRARGRIDEGFEARFPSRHPEPLAVSLLADPRISGHRQSQDAGPPGPAVGCPLARSLTNSHTTPKRPAEGRFCFREGE